MPNYAASRPSPAFKKGDKLYVSDTAKANKKYKAYSITTGPWEVLIRPHWFQRDSQWGYLLNSNVGMVWVGEDCLTITELVQQVRKAAYAGFASKDLEEALDEFYVRTEKPSLEKSACPCCSKRNPYKVENKDEYKCWWCEFTGPLGKFNVVL